MNLGAIMAAVLAAALALLGVFAAASRDDSPPVRATDAAVLQDASPLTQRTQLQSGRASTVADRDLERGIRYALSASSLAFQSSHSGELPALALQLDTGTVRVTKDAATGLVYVFIDVPPSPLMAAVVSDLEQRLSQAPSAVVASEGEVRFDLQAVAPSPSAGWSAAFSARAQLSGTAFPSMWVGNRPAGTVEAGLLAPLNNPSFVLIFDKDRSDE